MTFERLEDVPWATWVPRQTATLLFVVEPARVLLIRKKRGLGAGKINAPGGRLEPGETAAEAAVRESQEELRITPIDPVQYGTLSFQFVDGLSLFVHVFRADRFTGEPTETDEAVPLWFPRDELPFEEMWADDQLWVPLMLARRPFEGRFLFDGDRMVGYRLSGSAPPD